MCIYWDWDIVIYFKEGLKDSNNNLIMEEIKLQCLCSVEPKEVGGSSKLKIKPEKLLH